MKKTTQKTTQKSTQKSAQEMTPRAEPLLFVDAIDEGRARLLLDEDAFTVPASLLPEDAREGSWLRLSIGVVPAPASEADAIRKKLSRDDPGGPIKL
jgi:hypothetical protein